MNTSVSCKCLTPSNMKRRKLLSHILIFEKSFVLLLVFLRVFGATHFMLFPFIFIYGSHQNPTSYSLLSKLLIFLPACAALLVVLLSWTCWARGLYSHVLCTSLIYTHLVHLHYDATENINFYLPICAHERLAIFPYRNYRWKLPMFERKETSKRPWADKFFLWKNSESFRIFSWVTEIFPMVLKLNFAQDVFL